MADQEDGRTGERRDGRREGYDTGRKEEGGEEGVKVAGYVMTN